MVSRTNAASRSGGFRWLQLAIGIISMAMIANLQYGWTLFVDPIDAKYHWGRAAIQLAFTIFVMTETWLVPVEAWFVDKYGPRIVIMFGGVMIAVAWILNSYASSLITLYAAAIIAGMGAGAVYGTCVGNALKWFGSARPCCRRDRRGFWCGRGPHRGADCEHDRLGWLSERLLDFRNWARRHRPRACLFRSRARNHRACQEEAT
jgi:MFS family permease